jgi:hypothetical protein
VVISVPYRWKKTQTPSNIHDPVTEEKLYSWLGRHFDCAWIVTEKNAISRLIAIYYHDRKKFETIFMKLYAGAESLVPILPPLPSCSISEQNSKSIFGSIQAIHSFARSA